MCLNKDPYVASLNSTADSAHWESNGSAKALEANSKQLAVQGTEEKFLFLNFLSEKKEK